MKRKTLFIVGVSLLIVLSVTFFFYILPDVLVDTKKELSDTQMEAAQLRLHPLASKEAWKDAMETPVETWEEWVDATTEVTLGLLIRNDWSVDTPERVEAERARIRAIQMHLAELFKPILDAPPLPDGALPYSKLPGATHPVHIPSKRHEGPQTVEALMESFDEKYVELYPAASSYDAYYPRVEWIQMLLDRGVHFEDRNDYTQYLHMRGWVIEAESNPEWWTEGRGGVFPTDNFDAYKNAYIDRQVWQQETYKKVKAADPEATGIILFDNAPEKYLVSKRNTRYVYREKDGGAVMKSWGTPWTDEQSDALLYKGIEPEGINIIYVDKDYNILSEKPAPFDLAAFEISSRPVTPQEYEEYFGEPMPEEMRHEAFPDEQFVGDIEEFEHSEFDAGAVREAAQEAAAKAEFEKFENSMRQLETFSTMSDAEIEKALERQFRKQFLPEHPVEQLEQLTPERLERALGTLFQHGFEEGIRRVRQDNEVLANLLENYFGKQPSEVPKPPERPAQPKPQPPTPPEAP